MPDLAAKAQSIDAGAVPRDTPIKLCPRIVIGAVHRMSGWPACSRDRSTSFSRTTTHELSREAAVKCDVETIKPNPCDTTLVAEEIKAEVSRDVWENQPMLYGNGQLVPESVYVVMPAFNEGRVIASVIYRVRETLPGAHVVVVNDGSNDDTASVATAAGARVVNLPFNCGYGLALQAGLTYAFRAGADVVVTMDSDGQHDPGSIEQLITPIRKGQSDLVLGSRYLPQSVCYRVPALRRIVSHCLSLLLTLIAGQRLTDTTTGFQCMNRKTLGCFVTLKDFPDKTPDADLILYAIMTGARVCEVPVTMHEDQGGESMHGVFKSMFYVPNLFTAILSVLLQYYHPKSRST